MNGALQTQFALKYVAVLISIVCVKPLSMELRVFPDVRFFSIATYSPFIASQDPDVRTRQLETSVSPFHSWPLICIRARKYSKLIAEGKVMNLSPFMLHTHLSP